MSTKNLTKFRPSILRRLLPVALCCALAASVATAQDISSRDVHYLAKQLAFDGVAPEDVAHKIQPELLLKLEGDAEKTYFNGAAARVERAIVVSLQTNRQQRGQLLADKSQRARSALQQEVRASQDRVLRAVATKDRQGFTLRNRYKTLASFSAYADFHAVAALALQADVTYVEEMPVFQTQALLDVNSDETTETSFAHDIQGGRGAGVTIAIIDSGIDYTHSRLGGGSFPNSKVIGGWDYGDDDSDPKTDCNRDQHGTAAAFIAAGDGGVAPDAKLVHLKIERSSDCGGSGLNGDAVGALDWTITNQATYGIDIISMSFGGGSHSSVCTGYNAFRNALDEAAAAGMLLIAASGNGGMKGSLSSPACRASVTSVGAVYDRGWNSTYKHSNCKDKKPNRYEVTCYSNSASFLDILAPGTCAKVAKTGGGIKDCFSGTSAAAPFVAGVAALAKGKRPSLTNNQLKEVLVDTGISVTDPDNGMTTPLVNSLRAVAGAAWYPFH